MRKKYIFAVLLLYFILPRQSWAQAGEPLSTQYESLSTSLEKALEEEKATLKELKREKADLSRLMSTSSQELNAIRLQLSAFGNLVTLTSVSIEDLDKAQRGLSQIENFVNARVEELHQKEADLAAGIKEAVDQRTLNERQIEELKKQRSTSPTIRLLMGKLRSVNKLSLRKEKILRDLQSRYQDLASAWEGILHEVARLSKKVDDRLAERKREELFRRQQNPLTALSIQELKEELKHVKFLTGRLSSKVFWIQQFQLVWRSGGIFLITSILLFLIVEAGLIRIRSIFRREFSFRKEKPWCSMVLDLFSCSMPLLGAVVFIYTYATVRDIYNTVWILRFAIQVLLIWLFTFWGLYFLALLEKTIATESTRYVRKKFRIALYVGRWATIGYMCLEGLLGPNSSLLLIYRFFLELLFMAWSLDFWRRLRTLAFQNPESVLCKRGWVFPSLMCWGYLIAGGGLFLDLAGYALLATLWYANWGRSLVVLLWLFISFMALKEWEKAPETGLIETSEETRQSLRWLVVRILWTAWFLGGIVGILLAWGARRAIIITFFKILNTPIRIGGFSFQLNGLVYGIAILALIHVSSKGIKHFLRDRLFRDSGLEIGLQESITTVSVYILWFMGILIALNAVGFSSTSLTVVFGALGVGLGFGLQNIFNNFMSGLILLFERPIQVGDAVEIDGIWGEVKKINVRSTVVQTWDNASLIIPNSEFISGRVTNWSFKDLRLRRNIDVGVAYGSDVILVKNTLLEIARKHPRVLSYPEPSVLFTDFGDSALIFRLRAWTTVDVCLEVETDIRFEIARLFRERSIEIPFPQRDVHIRSVDPGLKATLSWSEEP